jgi:beta-lactamase class A
MVRAFALVPLLAAAGIVYGLHDNTHFKALASAKTQVQPPKAAAAKPAASVAPMSTSSATSELASAWQSIAAGRQGSVDIAVYNDATGQIAHYTNSGGTFDTASIVKLSILEGLLVEDQANGQSLSTSQLAEATPMIENSDNDAASDLWDEVGGASAMDNLFAQLGATSTKAGTDDYWGLTQTTALDQLKVLNALAYPGGLLTSVSAEAADSLLDNVEADQRWGVSGGVPAGVSVELKDGWLPESNGWVINSIGHVHGDGADYTIAVMTSGNPSEQYGIDTIQSLSSATWKNLSS